MSCCTTLDIMIHTCPHLAPNYIWDVPAGSNLTTPLELESRFFSWVRIFDPMKQDTYEQSLNCLFKIQAWNCEARLNDNTTRSVSNGSSLLCPTGYLHSTTPAWLEDAHMVALNRHPQSSSWSNLNRLNVDIYESYGTSLALDMPVAIKIVYYLSASGPGRWEIKASTWRLLFFLCQREGNYYFFGPSCAQNHHPAQSTSLDS